MTTLVDSQSDANTDNALPTSDNTHAAHNKKAETNKVGTSKESSKKKTKPAMQQAPQLKLSYGGCSLKGKRDQNQDAFLINFPQKHAELLHKGVVACIADGVSCSEHSQIASQTAAMQFISDYYSTPNSWSVKHAAGKILTSLNQWLFEQGTQQSLTHNGFVTTFSSIVIKSNTAHLFHIGDTRIYLIRNNKIQQLTRDHQRTNFGESVSLTRALGIDNRIDVDYQTVTLQEHDRFVLSTDGAHDMFEDNEFLSVCQSKASTAQDLESLANQVCEQAISNGSQDNTSCVIIDIHQLPQQSLLEHQRITLSRTVPPALSVGHKLDDYEVLKILYEGTRSHVYKVIERSTHRIMVMKVPSSYYSDDHEFLKQFSNEYWVGSQLDSHRVMKMYPKPRHSKFVYQLCEWIEGVTLRQWMLDNPTPSIQQVRAILDELIKAIRVLQRADMVHRDLKPENVMITDSGSVKIIDFGAVKVEGLQEISPEDRDSIPLGAINYIAPEYINTGTATTISDLFSAAVIGYEMLTGELPYKAASNQNLASARHTQWVYRSIKQYRDDIPTWVDLAFQKGTHFNAEHRHQALGEFIMDLYTPNPALNEEQRRAPLLKRNPILFWKSVAFISMGIAIVELLMLM